jgi:DNA-binding transcriptional ArsR family regulator
MPIARQQAREQLFSALAEPTRREIIEMLANDGKLTATQISQRFQASAPAISQHLKVLREASLVLMEKRAQKRVYQINREAVLEIEEWAKEVAKLWNERFDALDKVLAEEQKKKSSKKK